MRCNLGREGREVEQGSHLPGQCAGAERLGDEVDDPEIARQFAGLGGRPGRNDQHRKGRGRRVLPEDLTDAEPVDVRQHQVQQQQVGGLLLDQAQGLGPAPGSQDPQAGIPQVETDQFGNIALIIDTKYGGGISGRTMGWTRATGVAPLLLLCE